MSNFEYFSWGVPWEDLSTYSQAVRAGDQLFISGQLSHDREGTFLHEGDVEAQTEVTLANIDTILRHFGGERTDVVEVNLFVVNLRTNFEPAAKAFGRYFGSHRPASNAFGVVELVLPQQLIEIAARAILPSGSTTPASS